MRGSAAITGWIVWCGGLALSIAACTVQPDAPSPGATALRLGTGASDGQFYPRGVAIGQALAATTPSIDVHVETGGSFRNVTALEAGSLDVAFSNADVAFAAFHGNLPDQSSAYQQLRAVALFDVAPIHVLVRPGSRFRSFSDLRERRVDTGAPYSAAFFASQALLDAYRMTRDDVVVTLLGGGGRGYALSMNGLADGSLDAKVFVGNIPAPPVIQATDAGSRILPVDGTPATTLRKRYPFYRPVLIRGGTYAGQPDPIHTLGVETVLICRASLDEDLVYRITKTLFEQRSSHDPVVRWPSVGFAPATPIPLHAGAARYYREQEISR